MQPATAPSRVGARRPRAVEIVGFVVIGALLVAAIGAGLASLYRQFWGPTAFAERYVQLLTDGRAADALMTDGVGINADVLEQADLPAFAHDALLRSAALAEGPTDVRSVSEEPAGDGAVAVTLAYRLDDAEHETTFLVERTGWHGLVPTWRFAESPLAVLNVDVHGSWRFQANGFEVDKRQVSAAGLEAEPGDAIAMLAFAPMSYDVAVDTATTVADPVTVAVTEPLSANAAEIAAGPSEEFQQVIEDEAASWLSQECGSRNVLLPEDCPYGYSIDNLIAPGTEPEWSITSYPEIELVPDGAWWRIEPAEGVAHIELDEQSYFDGSISHVSEDVPFQIDGTVELLEDGSARIQIGAPLLR
ncbi:hypothetical protein [Microbacterium halophytorum]|uniref:hypothetical protein n=1 Tax=Microbacterium halophytorum TaxID=2067568 RepID=UPI000CFDC190|nr:hypothetical protein [Microbacterium halophytorum]